MKVRSRRRVSRVRTMATRARRQTGHRSRPAQQGLESRLASGEAVVAVIGLGYVGLPLACEFARNGLRVLVHPDHSAGFQT